MKPARGDERGSLLRKWLRLPVYQKLTVMHALLIASLVEVALRIAPVARVARWMGTPLRVGDDPEPPEQTSQPTPREVRRAQITIRVMDHWPFAEGTCLRQSLVVGHFLRKHHPRLLLGVKTDAGEVRAHAWIEIGQTTLGLDDSYSPFRRFA